MGGKAEARKTTVGVTDNVRVPVKLSGEDFLRLEAQCAIIGEGERPGPTVADLIQALVLEFLDCREDVDRTEDDPRDLEDLEGLEFLRPFLISGHGRKGRPKAASQ